MGKIADILDKLAGQQVYIDTNLFIYFLDQNPEFFAVASTLLAAVELGSLIAYTGDITVAETLVKPYQTDNILLVANIKAFFYAADFLSITSHDADTFNLCAQIRAKYSMKFADALHYATALKAGCKFFITNDTGIHSTAELEVILLKDLLN
jgi:predicted nucleic acid-binding protein